MKNILHPARPNVQKIRFASTAALLVATILLDGKVADAVTRPLSFSLSAKQNMQWSSPRIAAFITPGAIPLPDAIEDERRNSWIEIPAWLAGTWCTFTAVDSSSLPNAQKKDLSKVDLELVRITVLGTQQDHKGRIWQFANTPYMRILKTEHFVEEQIFRSLEATKTAKGSFSITAWADVTDIDARTGKRLNSFKERTTGMYRFVSDGEVKVTFDIYDCTKSGEFLEAHKLSETQLRLAPFRQTDTDPEVNLKAKFESFMRKNHPDGL